MIVQVSTSEEYKEVVRGSLILMSDIFSSFGIVPIKEFLLWFKQNIALNATALIIASPREFTEVNYLDFKQTNTKILQSLKLTVVQRLPENKGHYLYFDTSNFNLYENK